MQSNKIQPEPFSKYQKLLIAILALLQFTIILDFMIISPLGDMLMKDLSASTSQFGLVVSSYAFSAAISGIMAAGFADKYDRKKLLIFFYAGFILGTLLCGISTNYYLLLAARIVTGIFGGVIGSIVMAIVADMFAVHQRGRVMGRAVVF
jgi:predicted MFS family arabinose efflux permease